jgi:hypothetical protein
MCHKYLEELNSQDEPYVGVTVIILTPMYFFFGNNLPIAKEDIHYISIIKMINIEHVICRT